MNARCGTHPGLTAVGECIRCGDYACATCLDPSYPDHCVRCASRLPHGVAWEDPRAGGWPMRYLRTVAQMVTRPAVAFPGPVPMVRPLIFAGLCGLLVSIAGLGVAVPVAAPMVAPYRPEMVAAASITAAVLMTTGILFGVALMALSFAAGLHAVGRRVGTLRFALRACGYAQALFLVTNVPVQLAWLLVWSLNAEASPEAAVFNILSMTLWVAGTMRVCMAAARGLGLPPGRAGLAAIGPTSLVALGAAYSCYQTLDALLTS